MRNTHRYQKGSTRRFHAGVACTLAHTTNISPVSAVRITSTNVERRRPTIPPTTAIVRSTAAPHCQGSAPRIPNRYDHGNRNEPYWVIAA